MDNDLPPIEIQQAADKVRWWVESREAAAQAGAQPQQESAAERFKRAREIDQSKMPEWRDPRVA